MSLAELPQGVEVLQIQRGSECSCRKCEKLHQGCVMAFTQEHVVRILAEATEPLYSSEIAVRANQELPSGTRCQPVDLVKLMLSMDDQVSQLSDGRWTLKRRVA